MDKKKLFQIISIVISLVIIVVSVVSLLMNKEEIIIKKLKTNYHESNSIEDLYLLCDVLLYTDHYEDIKHYYYELLTTPDKYKAFENEIKSKNINSTVEVYNNLFWVEYIFAFVNTDGSEKLLSNTEELFSLFCTGDEVVYQSLYIYITMPQVNNTSTEIYHLNKVLDACAEYATVTDKIYIYTLESQLYRDILFEKEADAMRDKAKKLEQDRARQGQSGDASVIEP